MYSEVPKTRTGKSYDNNGTEDKGQKRGENILIT